MLWIFLLLSAAGGVASVLCGCGFSDRNALWIFPAAFVSVFLICVLLLALLVVVTSLFYRKERDLARPSRFCRFVLSQFSRTAFSLAGVRLHTDGLEKIPSSRRFLLVCNHRFAFDPMLFFASMGRTELAFIAKIESFHYPIVSSYLRALLCLPLDRNDDRQALKTIIRSIQLLKEDVTSVAIFPEGGTNRTDAPLLPYRNGAFKAAQKAGVPIVVCCLSNTRAIPKNMFRRRTDVYLSVLDVIEPERFAGSSTADISAMIRPIMEEGLNVQQAKLKSRA